VLTPKRRRLTLVSDDFTEAPEALGHISLPEPYAPNSPAFQRDVARRLARSRLARPRLRSRHPDPEIDELALAVADHACQTCGDLERHRRAWAQRRRLDQEVAELKARVKGRTDTLARTFDRVLGVLEEWGYLDGWALTEAGERLRRIYHETDLFIAACLDAGLFDGLEAADLAALASVFTFEARGRAEPATPWFPSADLRHRWTEIERLHRRLVVAEGRAGLPVTRALDPGFVGLAHAWASGDDLDEILDDEDLSGGDFVRTVKQLVDLLRQLGDVAPVAATAAAARSAAERLYRGVIETSSTLGAVDDVAEVVPGESAPGRDA
jgi:ATP-dependent RNA helicase HelY